MSCLFKQCTNFEVTKTSYPVVKKSDEVYTFLLQVYGYFFGCFLSVQHFDKNKLEGNGEHKVSKQNNNILNETTTGGRTAKETGAGKVSVMKTGSQATFRKGRQAGS